MYKEISLSHSIASFLNMNIQRSANIWEKLIKRQSTAKIDTHIRINRHSKQEDF